MPNTQYPFSPRDWSSEISYPQPAAQPAAHASASSTTTTTTTSTSSASSAHNPAAQAPAPMPQAPASQASVPGAQASAGQPAPEPAAPPSSGAAPNPHAPAYSDDRNGGPLTLPPTMPRSEFEGSVGTLDLQTHQPLEVIEAPTSMNEAFLGSLKAMLLRNRGSFVTATFLIGTQGTAVWEGILYEVGNDHIVVYQPGRQRYIACDLYSLKYIEFYDTRRQEMCDTILRQNYSF